MFRSKTPQVLGFVIMSAAVVSSTISLSSSTSTQPCSSSPISLAPKSAMVAVAGFVPCAVEGTRTVVLPSSPLSSKNFLTIRMLVSSPCAPASGCSETAGRPETSERKPCSSCMTSSAPCACASGWSGMEAGEARRVRGDLVGAGLCFIVQEPKG
jgi:hypothetical protein